MPAPNKARHRAAVLGANDGILSKSSLLLGVAAAHATHSNASHVPGCVRDVVDRRRGALFGTVA